MNFIQVTIKHQDQAIREILIAHLADIGFDTFEEDNEALYAYIDETLFKTDEVEAITKQYHCKYSTGKIKQENWNKQWEESFEPVVVDGFCTIRAGFHKMPSDTQYEIVITPKMSFGTGHHATTRLMIKQMQQMQFKGMQVLDFGTGTGVLAILADMMGAAEILAIDNDEWSYENTLENIELNNTGDIEVKQGSLEVVGDVKYDIILANINRHILVRYMQDMSSKLLTGGYLVLSGILIEDKSLIVDCAENSGLVYEAEEAEGNWLCIKFSKK